MRNQGNLPNKDIRIELGFKNNLILSKMEKKGFKTVSELCRAAGVTNRSCLDELIKMKGIPTRKNGAWRTIVLRLADFFKCLPDDLFSEFQKEHALQKNRAHAEMHFGEVQAMLTAQSAHLLNPVVSVERKELRLTLENAIDTLPKQLQEVLRARFGIGGPEMTLQELAERMGLTPEGVRQIEAKALRQMRNPVRSGSLRDFVDLDN